MTIKSMVALLPKWFPNSEGVLKTTLLHFNILTMATPQAYVLDIVGHSATIYYISGFVADNTAPAFSDA